MLSSAALYRERELAIASLHTTLRYHALAHDAFASLAAVQLINGTLALGATLGLFIYEWWASGPQRLLLLSLLRLAALLCVGLFAHKAFGTHTPCFLGIPRPALYRVALYLQILWFTSELLLGSALLVFLPLLQGSELNAPVPPSAPLYSKVIPVLYMVGMAGCLCFLTQLRNKRRFGKTGKGTLSPSNSITWIDSEASLPKFMECQVVAAPPEAMPAVTCEIVLMEHQLDTNESVLFVHKKLRPIKTRPESPNYLTLLKPIVQGNNKGPTAPQPLPPPVQPQQHLQQGGATTAQPPPLISLSSIVSQHAGGQHSQPAHPVYPAQPAVHTPPMQHLQQLAAASNGHAPSHQRQLSTAQSLSLSPAQSLSFTSVSREAGLMPPSSNGIHIIPLHGIARDTSSGGTRSITGRPGV